MLEVIPLLCGARLLASRILQLAALALAYYVLDTILSFPTLRARVSFTAVPRASCPPRAYTYVSYVSRETAPAFATRTDLRMHAKEYALAFAGFKGCTSSREFWSHFAADNESL
ncbi:hypothetical protein WOLCODRAFT_156603 [Wolfiporia cocos MD-104 SS10]|uniref:Uncharacterized protein n=1 Tax=Wolfiporia cocos (strain MD-104) TaxID=742152 RepID=A0A2H3J1P8_WOLCO|nr:hypothetical protein WOLCODRAFT_156603 [Wolfiporia cocos MD-104 SS10]